MSLNLAGNSWRARGQASSDGGRDRTTAYGGTVDYTLNIDLMRMGVLPGALIRFRAALRQLGQRCRRTYPPRQHRRFVPAHCQT